MNQLFARGNIQKMKIMASGPITSWQIDGETVETVADLIFLLRDPMDCSLPGSSVPGIFQARVLVGAIAFSEVNGRHEQFSLKENP